MTPIELKLELERIGPNGGAYKDDVRFNKVARQELPTILRALSALSACEGLAAVGQKILAKLDSETGSVTQWDADELRAAIAQLQKVMG